MVRVCAWCKKVLGEKEPLLDTRTTHGSCPECAVGLKEEYRQWRDAAMSLKGRSDEELFDKASELNKRIYSSGTLWDGQVALYRAILTELDKRGFKTGVMKLPEEVNDKS